MNGNGSECSSREAVSTGVVQATIREKRSSNGGPSPLLFGVEPIHDP